MKTLEPVQGMGTGSSSHRVPLAPGLAPGEPPPREEGPAAEPWDGPGAPVSMGGQAAAERLECCSVAVGSDAQALAPDSDRAAPVGMATGSSKIRARHLERLAVVYVRQSSPQQVQHHRESRERQYALVERAVAWGWPRERVRVIDEDQGRSGASAAGRSGFQELVLAVNLDQVGLILGIEMSRLARSCKDWYQLQEVCGIFDTLLADLDGWYDPSQVNDRLVLGLKATLSEMELHTMRNRLLAGARNKARRGELFSRLPRGYVRGPAGAVELDPDEQVQSTIRLLFQKFRELGNGHAVLRYLVRHDVRLPARPHGGPNRGQLQWRRPSKSALLTLLRHPMYAGAYSYGRSAIDPRRRRPGHPHSGRVRRALEHCQVLLRDRVPAYIPWDEFQRNQRRLAENRTQYDRRGAARNGAALLGGLLVCGRCGSRLRVCYGGRRLQPRYLCSAHQANYGVAACQSLEGRTLDALVGRLVLEAVEPAALELSLAAGTALDQERARLTEQWQQRIERSRYEAQRAARQYHAVEPEHRLVARELERRWDATLAEQRRLEEEFARWQHTTPPRLTSAEQAAIESLARDVPALWHALTTSAADRKTIVRHLVDRVVVQVERQTETVQATIHWAGGFQSRHQLRRRVASYQQLADYDSLVEKITQLHAAGQGGGAIAEALNHAGFRTPSGRELTAPVVTKLRERLAARHRSAVAPLPTPGVVPDAEAAADTPALGGGEGAEINTPLPPPPAPDAASPLAPGEWWAHDLARALEMPLSTLHSWQARGWVHGRKQPGWPQRWIYRADAVELDRLRSLRSRAAHSPPARPQLTTANPDAKLKRHAP